jgi:hypothetical protein
MGDDFLRILKSKIKSIDVFKIIFLEIRKLRKTSLEVKTVKIVPIENN